MRYLYSCMVLCLALLSGRAIAQNMVPNGNFEQYSTCPTGISALANCTGWRFYNAATTDYYNKCSSAAGFTNFAGAQYPASGDAYIGAIDYASTSSTYREYAARSITPLTPGLRYRVSMSVCLADKAGYYTNDLGVWFYDNGPTTPVTGTSYVSVTPQISYTSYGAITDTQHWVRLVDTFTADSAYDNIVIGGFGAPSPTSTGYGVGSVGTYAYYYIDSVVVDLDLPLYLVSVDTAFCVGDTIRVPFVALSSHFSSSNVFSLQLSGPTGSFASPTTLATLSGTSGGVFKYAIPSAITPGAGYQLRIKTSSPVDSTPGWSIDIGNVVPQKPVASNNGPACLGSTLALSASTATAGVSWSWTGPANFTSALQNPSITQASNSATGQYIVTAQLHGCKSKDTTTAIVINTINIVTNTSNSPVCEGDTLKLFGSLTTGTASAYSWTGPNGFHSSAKDTVLSNASSTMSGSYILAATITAGCIARDTVTTVVNMKAANHNAGATSPICSGNALKLSASSSSPGVSYSWSGPSSFSSILANPTIVNVTGAAAGRYIVSYTTGNGCYAYDTANVIVNQSPVNITASATTPVCQSDTMKLFATNGSSGVTWSWSGPNSFSASTQNAFIPSISLTATGRYYVRSTAANSCYRMDSVDITVLQQPQNLSASSNSPLCQGATLSLSGATTSSGVSFSWSGPNGFSSTSQNPSIGNAQPSYSGAYILNAVLNSCSIKDTAIVSIVPTPPTPVPTANNPVCVGQQLNFTAGVTAPGYLWTGPNGFLSTSQTPSIPNATAVIGGVYSVKSADGACLSAPATINIAVLPAPSVNMYPSPTDSICAGAAVSFMASSSNAGTNPVYRWYHNNTFITGASASSYNTNTTSDYDTYFCSVTSNGTCAIPYSDSSNVIQMRVFPWLAPAVSISASPTGTVKGGDLVTFTATPVNGGNSPAYQWKRNNKNELGALSYTWGARTLSDKDVVCVTMTSNYLCPQPKTANSNCITVSIDATGISNPEFMKGVKIYPNPVGSELIIEGLETGTTVQLTDMLGKVIAAISSVKDIEKINTTSLPAATYLLKLTSHSERSVVKIVKE